MAPTHQSLVERLLRALVRLLPEDFRTEFGASIKADLAERRVAGDRAGLVRRDLPSLLGAIGREHFSTLRQDIKYSLRMMRRTPGFTTLAVLMLALGTGVNVAMFSIIDAVMLRSPFKNPDQLVLLWDSANRQEPTAMISQERYRALVAAPGPFSAVAAFGGGGHVTTATGVPRGLDAECMSASMFQVLGTAPLIGRVFDESEDQPGAPGVTVLEHGYWQRLGGSPSIVGSTISINRTPATVIGVMPRGFTGPLARDAEAWVPLHRPLVGGGAAGCRPPATVNVFARIRDGLTIEGAQARLVDFRAESLYEQTIGNNRQRFLVMGAAAGFVLLIACFNVGGLQMERTLARRREMAVRLALGASRARLTRQMVTENVLLALAGSVAGVAAAWFTLEAVVSLLPTATPHLNVIEINTRALVVALFAASTAGVIAGLLPMALTPHLRPGQGLAGDGRASVRHGTWTRRALVVTELTLSVAVLIGAALMLQTFMALRPSAPGFDPADKFSMFMNVQTDAPAARQQFVADLFDRLRTAPGIRRVSASTYLPLRGNTREQPVTFAGTTARINTGYITPGFLEMMKIPLVSGRAFAAEDTAESLPVAIVDEVFAKRIRPDGNVLGERVAVRLSSDPPGTTVERRVVGVVGSTRYLGGSTSPRPIAYIPYAQDPINFFLVVVEADGPNAAAAALAVRRAASSVRPDLAVGDPDPMPAMVHRSVSFYRSLAYLLGVFAALAVSLSAIGLLATMGWWVRQRTRELGMRMALGATNAGIAGLVLRQGLLLAGTGIAGGLGLAALGTKSLQRSLYGVTPLDPATFVGCAVGMLLVSVGAIYFPVRRAVSVDPAVALRAE